jgi:hypothetical protein
LRGQVRELVHSVNNLSTKFDGLTREVIALGQWSGDREVATYVAGANQRQLAEDALAAVLTWERESNIG